MPASYPVPAVGYHVQYFPLSEELPSPTMLGMPFAAVCANVAPAGGFHPEGTWECEWRSAVSAVGEDAAPGVASYESHVHGSPPQGNGEPGTWRWVPGTPEVHAPESSG